MQKKLALFLVIASIFTPKALYCQEEKVTIKANRIFGDQVANEITAIGNVEINKANQTLISDKIVYSKQTGWIKSESETKLIDLEVGNMFSDQGSIKDDFSKGEFLNPILIFNDGSYLQSKKANKESTKKTSFTKPILSVCPNNEIVENDNLAGQKIDLITLHSTKTTIDSDQERIINKNVLIKVVNVPVFYTPYISIPTKNNKRSSGFLTPSYLNNSRLGMGLKTPYFINVSPKTNFTISPKVYFEHKQISVDNIIEQKLKYGEHQTGLELSNNEISSTSDINTQNRTESEYRYKTYSRGNFIYTKNSSVNFDILTVGDKDYLRDFDFQFLPYTESELNYEYTKNRDYIKISSVRFQELEQAESRDEAQWVLPSINHHIQSKPQSTANETYSLSTNITSINRENGLQYNRVSTTPKVEVPLNISGNLFKLELSNQIDYYILQYNYDDQQSASANRLDSSQSNQKPMLSASWKLPLIRKAPTNTIIIEPQVKFTSSTTKKNFIDLPNEDSNNSELTINNLFSNDRMSGYDRNENGERINYGANSTIYSTNSKFEFDIGQSYLINQEDQDIEVNGFNNNKKSNIVGKTSYEYKKIFGTTYNFQLDESNLNNKVNYVSSYLNYSKFNLTNDYLLIRKGILSNEKIAQDTFGVGYSITPKLQLSGSITKNLVTRKNLIRRISIKNNGCCVVTEFSVAETNTSNLVKRQRSFNLNITVKGL